MMTRGHIKLGGGWRTWLIRCEYRGKGILLASYPRGLESDCEGQLWRWRRGHRWEDSKLRFIFLLILGPIDIKLAVDDE